MQRAHTMRLAVALLLTVTAIHFAHAQAPRPAGSHGGEVVSAGPYGLELVTAHNEIAVYVTDASGTNLSTAGGKGKAVVHTGGRHTSIDLMPSAPNILVGHGRYRLSRSSIVYVTVDLKHERARGAVFRPLPQSPPRRSQH